MLLVRGPTVPLTSPVPFPDGVLVEPQAISESEILWITPGTLAFGGKPQTTLSCLTN